MEINEEGRYILGLDVSTKCIGIALYEDLGEKGKLKLLHHISPKVTPKPDNKMQELFEKVNIFEQEFLTKYSDIGIYKVIIEEPLLGSNNVNTVATLLRFNGMISKSCYDILGITPEFISSYDARAYAFPELLAIRKKNKKGELYPEKELKRKTPVLFGDYDWEVDKKEIIWDKVCQLEPQIVWLYDKNKKLKKENYDMSDALTACRGFMLQSGKWKT